jgi:hypothetical protein
MSFKMNIKKEQYPVLAGKLAVLLTLYLLFNQLRAMSIEKTSPEVLEIVFHSIMIGLALSWLFIDLLFKHNDFFKPFSTLSARFIPMVAILLDWYLVAYIFWGRGFDFSSLDAPMAGAIAAVFMFYTYICFFCFKRTFGMMILRLKLTNFMMPRGVNWLLFNLSKWPAL